MASPALTTDPAPLGALLDLALRHQACASLAEVAEATAVAGTVALPGRAILVQLWDEAATGGLTEAHAGGEMSASMLRLPLPDPVVDRPEAALGEIVVDAPHPVGADERALLAILVESTANAARRLLECRRLERARRAAILAMARVAEHHDAVVGRHLERVGAYARVLARGLRDSGWYEECIDEGWIHDLECAAFLHDVGKVAIPAGVLLKAARLNASEWDLVKTHSEVGAQTIESTLTESLEPRLLELAQEVALGHHERWDGSGYPSGVVGEATPLSARIVALADVYDALTSERPFRGAWSHEQAAEWIRERNGVFFEPAIVGAFLENVAEIDAIRHDLADHPTSSNAIARHA